ncbi:GNAT family N-acetyltransferase [Streptomyces sp. NPDC093568]|uniref:GNAT family N-acetyltransferase n=1 Tax=Streptomyces sp. NPDC093568 TaxID=3366041 RepID=UPI0038195F85
MTVIVRDLRTELPADVERFAHSRHLALPYVLWTPDGIRHRQAHTHPDAHYRSLVAEEDGETIGTAQVGIAYDSPEPGQGYLNIYVRPDRTRRGAGGLLVRAAEEHLRALGATKLFSWVLDEPDNRAFAERHGYRASRSALFLRLDLVNTALPPIGDLPPDVELRAFADFADDPRPLFELDAETTSDEPSDVGAELTEYETWVAETWKHPLLDPELSMAAVVDGRPAAFSIAFTDRATRYSTAMTGTARAHRGRGLAKLAKNASLHRARAAGYREAFTGNDTDNEPMLAINRWFGYEICATEVRHVRELG